MCLILFAVNPNTRYRLIVAANRDELYARPTQNARFWDSHPGLLAGQDKNMGGTWLGVNKKGAFAAVTNFMETLPAPLPSRSRGELPTGFLANDRDPKAYLDSISSRGNTYKGFNLIVANETNCCYYGNRAGAPRELGKGYYGLSNQTLDCDWPKVIESRAKLAEIISAFDDPCEALFSLLLNQGDDREFSSSFIAADTYGTRATTVVLIGTDGEVVLEERNFGAHGNPLKSNRFQFNCDDGS
jgi:uncharacterized protein with NRDE domain